jgi:hypothetical protein
VPEEEEEEQQAPPHRVDEGGVCMSLGPKHPHRSGGAFLAMLLIGLAVAPASAGAAGPPVIGEVWASLVFSASARVSARLDPNGLATTYHIDYISKASYDANVAAAKDPFSGTARIPLVSDASAGSGSGFVAISQQLSSLSPDTAYRYRLVAKNSAGTTMGGTFTVATQVVGGGALLPDDRSWEMVSPVDKNGGQIEPSGAIADGGVLQAAADGQSVTYGSSASFGEGAQGAASASQYLAARAAGGWTTQNLTAPLYSGSYGTADEGVPYRLFSADLTRALMLNGRRCRGEDSDCAVPNPPLAGTDAPEGYQNLYLREGGSFVALLGSSNADFLSLEPSQFELRLSGTSPDLRHPVLSTCAALSPNATEVPLGEGCDPDESNLYEWSSGSGLALVNLEPGDTQGTPGASLAAPNGAISADGSRVYFVQGGVLYLRKNGTSTSEVAAAADFQTASSDGTIAYYLEAGHLYRYEAAVGASTDLTPAGGVAGVLGASENGAYVYYQDAGALKLWHGGSTVTVVAGANAVDPSDYPPATGTARVSPDGTHLLFVSTASLTGYDNKDLNSGNLDSEIYLYDASGGGSIACPSCNPTFARPIGPSSIPGAIANGTAPGSPQIYKPRALSVDGKRVFFDSEDAIGLVDTNNRADVYQWEAQGAGSCTRAGGCLTPISSGRSSEGASFVDASVDGNDVFFLTDGSLVGPDPGAVDLYDARVGGGLPEPQPPLACEGDACQPLPSPPVDPTLTTLLTGPGNPAVHYPGARCRKGQVKRRGKCVKKKAGKHHRKRGKV